MSITGQSKRLTPAQRVEAQSLADEIAADENLIDELAFEVVALRAALRTARDFIGTTQQYKCGDVGASNVMNAVVEALS